jgi:hypothetical protein
MKKGIKRTSLLASLLAVPVLSQAQWQQAAQNVNDFKQFMFDIAPMAFIVILLGGALFNIGKVWGERSDWKGFFTSVGVFVLAVSLIVGIIGWIASLRFG